MTLIIVAVSFEERCRALVESLGEETSNSEVLVVQFEGYENIGEYLYNRVRIHRDLDRFGAPSHIVNIHPSRPLESLHRISSVLHLLDPSDVVLDISVLPRYYLFGLCRLLASIEMPTRVRYYRPQFYGDSLSRGIGTVTAIPGFEGEMNMGGTLTLGIILGFEGYKAIHAWERIGPTRCIALFGDPAYREEFLEVSRCRNADLLSTSDGIEERSLHTYDVGEAVSTLQRVWVESIESERDSSLILCPLGTKLQSLACFAVSFCNPEIGVVNVSSLVYYTGDYSRGVEPSYSEYPLQEILSWCSR